MGVGCALLLLVSFYRWRAVAAGIKAETLPSCVAAGADVLVAGSAIYGSDDWSRTISELRALADGVRVA